MTASRLERLRRRLAEQEVDALLVSNLLNVRYLSGYTGSSGRLLISADCAYIISDSRYEIQCAEECPQFTLSLMSGQWEAAAVSLIREMNPKIAAFEGDALSFYEWSAINSALTDTKLLPADNFIASMRLIKDAEEIESIRTAARIADETFIRITGSIETGMTERCLTAEIDCELRRCGASKEGFDTIAISGPRSALIHGKGTDRRIEAGDLVLMDFGAYYDGYNSDITRTVVVGRPDARQEQIYNIVLEAQKRVIDAVKPGVSGYDIDAAARDFICEQGFGECFGHGLGHGLGLHIHDSSAFSRYSALILQAGMVATVEPGIYIPGWGGIRIEDDILVTESGCEILTSAPRTLGLR